MCFQSEDARPWGQPDRGGKRQQLLGVDQALRAQVRRHEGYQIRKNRQLLTNNLCDKILIYQLCSGFDFLCQAVREQVEHNQGRRVRQPRQPQRTQSFTQQVQLFLLVYLSLGIS